MFCPNCKYEYVEGIKLCSTCGEKLVDELPQKDVEKIYEYVELVTVMETGDFGLLGVAKSILDGAGIRYLAKGENSLNLFTMSVGYNPLFRQVELQVGKDDVEIAKELLKDLLAE